MDVNSTCPDGIPINTDISGKGVRIALYLQSFLTVILIRVSPDDAPSAYWTMTTTSLALLASSFITAAKGTISLLDAIISLYILFIPIIASAFGIARLTADTHRLTSPLLILANWTRSALTYAFALYVWVTATSFGSQPGCNSVTNFIFFGAALPALRAGRILNLSLWGLGSAAFTFRLLRPSTIDTLLISLRAIFFVSTRYRLLRPRRPPPPNQWVFEETIVQETRLGQAGPTTRQVKVYRDRGKFYTVLSGLTSLVVGGGDTRVGKNVSLVIALVLTVFAIIMTELELRLNDHQSGDTWGFGQILPMLLTIAPAIALLEWSLTNRSGPGFRGQTVRLTLHGAQGLPLSRRSKPPTAFAVVTAEEQVFTTYESPRVHNPQWEESFDVEVSDTSPIVIRVFDLEKKKVPVFVGYNTLLPLEFFQNVGAGAGVNPAPVRDLGVRPLFKDGEAVSGAGILISLSTDTSEPIPEPQPPAPITGPDDGDPGRRDIESRGYYVKVGYGKFSKTWVKRTDRSRMRM